jgi:hypothetical protein
MPRKRANKEFVKELDKNVPRNPLVQPPGSVWTQMSDKGETQLWGAHVDNSIMSEGMGSFKTAGVIVILWEVPLGEKRGTHVVVINPWNHRPLRVYSTMLRAIGGETLKWKIKNGITT